MYIEQTKIAAKLRSAEKETHEKLLATVKITFDRYSRFTLLTKNDDDISGRFP
ncbi:hypothetical protein [Thermoactinomyces mirandus]|uniref:hypothetical protein n=1 Tax=Thermoactinomyces mirandus TaxID=2756294 RepID=UPI0015EECCA1|nr:hypothetical protein [Thermoactinomyces mirandus]